MSAVLDRIESRAAAREGSIRIVDFEVRHIAQALTIAREMHQNSIYADMALNETKVVRQLAACGNLVPDRYFRIAERGEEVLGGFYGHVRRTFFNDDLLAHDMGWWVKSSVRGGAAAAMLLADFERWAREQGAKKVMVGQSTEINIERTTKLFEHCGFRVIGFNTVKDL